MNPNPLLGALMGSGYPRCKLETRPVGDETGVVRNAETGDYWVEDPSTLVQCNKGPGDKWLTNNKKWSELNSATSRACQTRWVLDKMVTKEEWDADEKIYNPDGTPATQTTEGFVPDDNRVLFSILATLIVANIWALSRRWR